jgi:hypothetical protein
MPKDATPVYKTNPGRFFEDYSVGDVIEHAVPRTVSGGERALYHALYPRATRSIPPTNSPAPAVCRKVRSTIWPRFTSSSANRCRMSR